MSEPSKALVRQASRAVGRRSLRSRTASAALTIVDLVNQAAEKRPWLGVALKGTVGLIPGGSYVTEILQSRASRIEADRETQFKAEVAREVAVLGDSKLDVAFIQSDEFVFVCRRAFNAARSSRQREKVQLFARILARSATVERRNDVGETETFLGIVDSLSVNHMHMFAHLATVLADVDEPDQLGHPRHPGAEDLAVLLQVDVDKIVAYGEQMVRHGILFDAAIGRMGYRRGKFGVTTYGKRFARFVAPDGD